MWRVIGSKIKMATGDNMDDDENDAREFIKTEVLLDEDDIVNWTLEEDIQEIVDPLLTMTPIVYTTKLDDMHIMNKDLREVSANEIIQNLSTESKPILTQQSTAKRTKYEDIDSYIQVASIVQQINFKARLKIHNIKTRNTNLLKQCKPLSIVLKDIKKTPPNNQANALKDISNGPEITDVTVKIERVDDSDSETSKLKVKSEVIAPPSPNLSNEPRENSPPNKSQQNCSVPNDDSRKTQQRDQGEIKSSAAKKFKPIESPRPSIETKSYNAKTKQKKTRVPNPESSDEDDTTLINYKKNPVITQAFSQEKYVLIVLLYEKDEAHVYRVNPLKLVTDFYITFEYDEYKIAAMYPKEEKIIERYCCWFKREEIITKICLRKNYSFTIQKFLRRPHTCHPGHCNCCCHVTNSSNSSSEPGQIQRINVVKKSLSAADDWVRDLINRKKPANLGLIGKALIYAPKIPVNVKPTSKEPQKYLECVLLSFQDTTKKNLELYEIGKNGDVLNAYLLDRPEKEYAIKKTYISMGLNTIEATYCCWYMREKLMIDLCKVNVSPTVRKLLRRSHNCEKNNCNCCCKPQRIALKYVEVLPPTFKHTSTYEKNAHLLNIRFNVKSKFPHKKDKQRPKRSITKIDSPTVSENEDAPFLSDNESTVSLSEVACTQKIQDISTRILSKFKKLKLGVNKDGKLEAQLETPAKNLSIPELKVLSEIFTLSTKQIAKLGISPEEFCKRINTKTCQSNNEPIPGINRNSSLDNSSSSQHIGNQDSSILSKLAPAKIVQPALVKHNSKSFSHMYSSISNLMETKNKNFVDSFKSFFQGDLSAVLISISKPVANIQSFSKGVLPRIADTFTLAKSSAEATVTPKAGTSRITRRSRLLLQAESSKSTSENTSQVGNTDKNTRTYTAKRKGSHADSQHNKKIRVKAPSELMTTNTTQETSNTDEDNSQINSTQKWPGPIIIKQEPQTNIQTIVRSAQPVSIKLNQSMPAQAYIIGNNVVSASNIKIVNSNNVYHVNGNGLTNDQSNGNKNMCYLTLTPMTVTGNTNNSKNDKSMLAQILNNPQVQPAVPSAENPLPPLVPIRSVASTSRITATNDPVMTVKNEIPD